MIEPEELIEFVRAEQRRNAEQQNLHSMLSDDAMCQLGRAVSGLMITRQQGNVAWMECANNESRIRPGSHVTLSHDGIRLAGEVIAIETAGTVIQLNLNRLPSPTPDGPWILVESERDFTPLVVQSIDKLRPGAPGWSFYRSLAAIAGKLPMRPVTKEEKRRRTIKQVLDEFDHVIDDSQHHALVECVNEPSVLGVQGPPGTGKTVLLALVAESLARLGRRVLIVAPTHQAVNNAIGAIRHSFADRKVIKVGNPLRRESLPDDVECKSLKNAIAKRTQSSANQQIIGMTFLSAMQQLAVKTSGLAPNVVLLDEAGQLPLPQGLCTGLFGAGSVLMFGDDSQMPPIFSSATSANPIATSIFSQLRRCQPQSFLMLNTTYRLNLEICDFVARSFYADAPSKLTASTQSSKRQFNFSLEPCVKEKGSASAALLQSRSICWIKSPENGSRQINLAEAESVSKVVTMAMRAGVSHDRIAIVTPFRRQAAAIRRLIQVALGDEFPMTPVVDTVERVQGLTVDLVIFSLCTTDIEYASEVAAFLFSPNRLNVAVSRARTKVIIFACEHVTSTTPSEYEGLLATNTFKHALSLIQYRLKLE